MVIILHQIELDSQLAFEKSMDKVFERLRFGRRTLQYWVMEIPQILGIFLPWYVLNPQSRKLHIFCELGQSK